MRFFRKLLAPLNLLFSVSFAVRCLRLISEFFRAWLKSRNFAHLLMGLIPVAAAGVMVWSVWIARLPSHREKLLDEYLTSARQSVMSGDIAECRINFRRAIELANGSSELRFDYATSLFSLGEQDEAVRMLSGMAPLRTTGYLPAHRFLAENYRDDDPARSDLIRALHLGHLIRQSRDNREDRQRLLALLLKHKSYDRADRLLRDTLDQHPEDRLTLVRLKTAAGQPDRARREAELAVESLTLMIDREPRSSERRIQLAQAHIFLGQFSRAMEVLTTGLRLSPDESLVAATSRTCDHWLRLLDDHQRTSQLRCLTQLLQTRPAGPETQRMAVVEEPEVSLAITAEVVDQVDRASVSAGAELLSRPFGDLLRTALSSGQSSILLPFLVGTVCAAEGDLEAAETNLREALQLSMDSSDSLPASDERDPAAMYSLAAPVVCNNLAFVLFERAQRLSPQPGSSPADQGDAAEPVTEMSPAATLAEKKDSDGRIAEVILAEALALSTAAVEQIPDAAEFRETRGQILALLGHHEEAISELNGCLALQLSTHAVHQTLFNSYSRLGRSPEALEHFELARRRRKGD